MALHSVRYDMDPLKGGKTRDYHDFNRRKATIVLRVTGTIAGISIDINTPPRVVAGLGAITVAEPGDFADGGADKRRSLLNLVEAIARKTDGALKARLVPSLAAQQGALGGTAPTLGSVHGDAGVYEIPAGGDYEVVLEAAQAGSWGEGITFVHAVTANAANLSINGIAGAGARTAVNGAGPDAVLAFQTFLQGLGVPLSSIRVAPLFTESSSFLVTWET